MKILLTGATGFIGKHLLKALLAQGHPVRVLVRNDYQETELAKMGAQVAIGDLANPPADLMAGMEAVFHLGALRYEWEHSRDEFQKINTEGTRKLLDLAREEKIKKFIFCSTVFVFGYPKKIPVDETFPYAPTTLYAASKRDAEKIVKEYFFRHKLPTTIIQPTITYGPEDTRGMLLKLCRLIKSQKFVMIGNGENRLHLTHIDDVLEGFLKALAQEKSGGDYIIASGRPIVFKELVKLISGEVGAKVSRVRIPLWLVRSIARMSDFAYKIGQKMGIKCFFGEPFISRSKVEILAGSQSFKIDKAHNELGFSPQVETEEGIQKTIHWFQENGYL